MRVQLSGQVPSEATNGLLQHAKEFFETPLKLVPVVAMVACTKKVEKTETGEQYAVLKFHHIEVVPERHRKAFGKMLGDALGSRTGAMELPFPDGGEVPMKETEPFPEAKDEDAFGGGDGDED